MLNYSRQFFFSNACANPFSQCPCSKLQRVRLILQHVALCCFFSFIMHLPRKGREEGDLLQMQHDFLSFLAKTPTLICFHSIFP